MVSGFFGQVSFTRGVWTLYGVLPDLVPQSCLVHFFSELPLDGLCPPPLLLYLCVASRFPCRPLTWASSLASRLTLATMLFHMVGLVLVAVFIHVRFPGIYRQLLYLVPRGVPQFKSSSLCSVDVFPHCVGFHVRGNEHEDGCFGEFERRCADLCAALTGCARVRARRGRVLST